MPKPFLLVGDFNAHCTLWGSEKTDQRGKLIDFILSNDICLLNSHSPRYFSPNTRKVLETSYGSDHLPAVVKLSSTLPTTNCRPPRWKLHRADWLHFMEVAKLEDALLSDLTIDETNEKITSILIAAAEKAIPQSSTIVRKKLNPWWTQECMEAKKLQNKAWGVLRRYPTYSNLIQFKQAKAKARYVRRQAQKLSWQKYVSSLSSTLTSKRLSAQIRKFRGDYSSYNIPLLTTPGIQTALQEHANILGEHFHDVSSSANFSNTFIKYKQSAEKQRLPTTGAANECYNSPITLEELNRVLSSGEQTAVGPDRIHYSMLAHLSHTSTKALLSQLLQQNMENGDNAKKMEKCNSGAISKTRQIPHFPQQL